MLGAGGQADGVRMDVLLLQLLCRALAVRGGSRMDNQRLYVCNICQNGENLQRINELLCFLFAALDVEGENGACTVREVLVVQFLILRVQGCMVDGLNQRLLLEIFQNLLGVLYVTFYAQRQGFQTLQQQECVERRDGSAGIAQQNGANLGGERCRSAGIYEADAVIGRIRIYQICTGSCFRRSSSDLHV